MRECGVALGETNWHDGLNTAGLSRDIAQQQWQPVPDKVTTLFLKEVSVIPHRRSKFSVQSVPALQPRTLAKARSTYAARQLKRAATNTINGEVR